MKKVFYLILAGVTVGMLLAPGNGIWKKITDCVDDLKTKAKNSFNDLANGAKDIATHGKNGAKKASRQW